MSKQYYGLVSGLKKLLVGKESGDNLSQFRNWLSVQLEPSDYYQASLLFYKFDNQNLLSTFFNQEGFIPYGNLNHSELSQIVKTNQSDKDYFQSFLDKTDLNDEKLTPFLLENLLANHFYSFLLEHGNSFIKHWAQFEITLKNLTAVYSLRNLNFEDENQVIEGGYFTGLELKRINIADLDKQYPFLKQKFEALAIEDPIARKRQVDEIKWQYLEDKTFFTPFGIERILAYSLKLLDLEVWKSVNEEKGNEKLNIYISHINSELETLIQ